MLDDSEKVLLSLYFEPLILNPALGLEPRALDQRLALDHGLALYNDYLEIQNWL
jgi:hypothetical protein